MTIDQLEPCLKKILKIAEENFIDWKDTNGIVKFPLEFKEPIKISIDNTDQTRHLIIEYLKSKKFTVLWLHIFAEDEYDGGYIGEVLVQDKPKDLLPSVIEDNDGEKWYYNRRSGISTIIMNMSFIPAELRKEYVTLSKTYTKLRKEISKLEKYIENLQCSLKLEVKYEKEEWIPPKSEDEINKKKKDRKINDLGMKEM